MEERWCHRFGLLVIPGKLGGGNGHTGANRIGSHTVPQGLPEVTVYEPGDTEGVDTRLQFPSCSELAPSSRESGEGAVLWAWYRVDNAYQVKKTAQ